MNVSYTLQGTKYVLAPLASGCDPALYLLLLNLTRDRVNFKEEKNKVIINYWYDALWAYSNEWMTFFFYKKNKRITLPDGDMLKQESSQQFEF